MSPETWRCWEIHVNSLEQLNNLIRDIVALMRRLKEEAHVESYFFNRYSNPSENAYFVKFGLVNGDETAQSELNDQLENHSAITDATPYACEMREVDGVAIDKIKCISCELYEKVQDSLGERITIEQAFYLIHFLMNQLGYSYLEEYELYGALVQDIGRQLGRSA